MKLPLDGGCLCGAVRYRISAAPIDAGYCHCRMCQRSAGAPVVAWLTMASEGFAWTKGAPAAYRSSPEAERLFCGACGTPLLFEDLGGTTHDFSIATLDDPGAVVPKFHIYYASRIDWAEAADGLPQYPRGRHA